MSEPLFSSNWYRVAQLRPRLAAHARIHRHVYRGQTWHVLADPSSERYHRFSPAAHAIIGLMDGHRTVDEIWRVALEQLGDDAVTQDEMIQLLGKLHTADVLLCNVTPDAEELFRRRRQFRRRNVMRRVFALFAWQIPLFDPERFLARTVHWSRPLFTVAGFAVWLLLVGLATVLAVTHWNELTENVLDRVLSGHNLLMLWLLFPLVKAVHEFGHAYAVKSFGGEVHEMGVMILVLTPVPYVDASSAWSFRSKWQRVTVGGAGMMVELALAAVAMVLWVMMEPGFTRALLYNVMLIAGISTVLFNINPLLRFDGYYMLSDWLEIPNLRSRANQYLAYLAERYLFKRAEAEPPHATPGERRWFVAFSVSAFCYRILVVIAIFVFLGDYSLILAFVFAAFTLTTWFLLPGGKIVNYLLNSPRLRRVRRRALTVSGALALALVLLIAAVPVPFRSVAEGVVWVPEEGMVRAGVDGFVVEVLAQPGQRVGPGDPLIRLREPMLATELQVLNARLRELDARYRQGMTLERVKLELIREEQRYVRQQLARVQERTDELVIRSRAEGVFVLPRAADLPGRFARQGDVLAHVLSQQTTTVRTVVPQQDIHLVRERTRSVQVRLAEEVAKVFPGAVTRVVPAASDELPTPALGSQGGGALAVDPSDPKGRKAVQRFFQLELTLPHEGTAFVGGHAFVRFDFGWEPLGTQWYRQVRQLFLARFNV